MYGRKYGERTLRFEPSGGLLQASLVMQDKETDSYWSIMTGDSIAGQHKGTRLRELPVGKKAQWKEWVAEHPDTLVLSVDGVEEGDYGYEEYFESDEGFGGLEASDARLATKQPIYSFQIDGKAYAVPFTAFEGGAAFRIKGAGEIFLYRPADVAIFYSTHAFQSSGFENRDGHWHDAASGARFDPGKGVFEGGQGASPSRLPGFDTFWYNWSLIHPDTEILGLK